MPSELELAGSITSQWGEGPIWYRDTLYYVDIEGHRVVVYVPTTATETTIDVGERIGTIVPRARGGLVMAGDNGFAFVDPDTGERTPIADPEPDNKPDNRFNDGKCDPSGRFWAGTISTIKKEGSANLYMLDTDGKVSLKFPGVTNSNGLCWSAAADTFYYIDTPTKKVRAFDYDNATGAIDHERIAIDTAGVEGSPDGMAIDTNGHLWIAFCRGSAVVAFDPSNGRELHRIPCTVSGVTACAFGGPNLEDLYITTGIFKNLEESDAGRLFVTRPGVCGQPSHAYGG
ncbi:MAG: SMP-30/gluconolactonase/LRE family protein [Verrucomicrobiota bacterium]